MPQRSTQFGKPKTGEVWDIDIPEDIDSRGRIPAGDKYLGKLVDVKKDKAKSSGNPMFVWSFLIVSGPQAGRDFNLYTALTPDSMWKVVETLEALGVEVTPGEPVRVNKRDLIGRMCLMNIQDDSYNGRPTSKLNGIAPHPKGAGVKSAKPGISAAVAEDEEEESVEEETDQFVEELEDDQPSEDEAEPLADDEEVPEDEPEEEPEEEEEPVRRPVRKVPPKGAVRRPPPPAPKRGKGKSRL